MAHDGQQIEKRELGICPMCKHGKIVLRVFACKNRKNPSNPPVKKESRRCSSHACRNRFRK